MPLFLVYLQLYIKKTENILDSLAEFTYTSHEELPYRRMDNFHMVIL